MCKWSIQKEKKKNILFFLFIFYVCMYLRFYGNVSFSKVVLGYKVHICKQKAWESNQCKQQRLVWKVRWVEAGNDISTSYWTSPKYPTEELVALDDTQPGPEVIKLFSYSTQLSMKFFLLINIKMPTIVGILIFISRKNFMLSSALQEKNV